MTRITSLRAAFALVPVLALSGCALLDPDPARVTLAELLAGTYDRDRVEGVDLSGSGLDFGTAATFCEAAGRAPLRWTDDALVPMQVWVDTYATVEDVPEAAAPSVQLLLDHTRRRLRWSLTGEGERPTWDGRTIAAAETLMDVAISDCPDLPMVVGLPGQSDRPAGWSDMSDAEVTAHCESMADRFGAGVAEFEAHHGRPPRHGMELDLPTTFYATSDFHGVVIDADGRAQVVPVPGGACDLGVSE